MRPAFLAALTCLSLAACASPRGLPSLAPRAAEAIDPRVPIASEVVSGPASGTTSSRVAALVGQARAGDGQFEPLIAAAERLAGGAGAAGSEGWIVAQQALSAAEAARRPVATALGDIDSLAADALQRADTIAPGDLNAIQQGAAEIRRIDDRQSDRAGAVRRRLGG
ncbi:hypothetical protein HMF7854_05685 [Sphingomonas ginkgonis]|uniref:DUF4398 domain-containing protein n=1 Tax=Sphingomonas ginkgonis TaxID=2315330 RepID=A0A429V8U9_9SPHN|nr:hypothetical protein [Sphingomonas ginkgonis]RST30369.1 hypothetical protein HMF7854_05685 [Sphingomonas ginkgonis]